ncbi:hypothetical protein, partial [Aeromonas sp. PrichA-15]|uniref:hypothetical protein n=1 Tax=Aeromonas sp. PrichA-15 TaxID=2823360 RepID=UPI001B340622
VVGIPAECMVFLLMGGAYLRSRIKQAGKWDQETIVSFFLCQYCSGEYLPFSEVNSGHLAFLIHDIIKLCEPIKLSEIELVLISLIIDCPVRKLTRLLYLLEKTNFIAPYEYSGSTYYYVKNEKLSKIKYGKSKSGKIFDFPNAKMQVRKSFAPIFPGDEIKGRFDDEISKKRYNALKRINAIREAQ